MLLLFAGTCGRLKPLLLRLLPLLLLGMWCWGQHPR
jgi:hypothetical protein